MLFGIFVYDGVEPIDLATFGVLSMARRIAPHIQICTIAPKAGLIRLSNGLDVVAQFGINDAPACDIVIVTGAWTNMSIEHTARTGADKGYVMVVPEDCCSTMNADWHRASINYALQNVSAVTKLEHVLAALR